MKCLVEVCENEATYRGAARGWCTKHYQRWQKYGDPTKVTILRGSENQVRRFLQKVRPGDGCWEWLGNIGPDGYSRFSGVGPAHRFAYELLIGPIPEGYELDHLCHSMDSTCLGGYDCPHRRCVNPAHLEPVTKQENGRRSLSPFAVNARKDECPRGHPYTEENTWVYRGSRYCRECRRVEARERKRRIRAARRAA